MSTLVRISQSHPRPALARNASAMRELPIQQIGSIACTPSDEAVSARKFVGEHNAIMGLLPIMAVVSIAFLIIGFALPVLPLHVHHDLGLSTFVVGLVTGSQFAASLFSRVWAGHFADRRGAKRAVIAGLVAAALSGGLYLVSLAFSSAPWLSRPGAAFERRGGATRSPGNQGKGPRGYGAARAASRKVLATVDLCRFFFTAAPPSCFRRGLAGAKAPLRASPRQEWHVAVSMSVPPARVLAQRRDRRERGGLLAVYQRIRPHPERKAVKNAHSPAYGPPPGLPATPDLAAAQPGLWLLAAGCPPPPAGGRGPAGARGAAATGCG
jgi:hypothetical protein